MSPMYIIFDNGGQIQSARVLKETDAAWQVELPSGKRQKVKKAKTFMQLEQTQAEEWLEQAKEQSGALDLDLIWEFAPEGEAFGFAAVAADYFGESATALEKMTTLVAVQSAPHYFRRAGQGQYKKASREVVEQALAAIAKKAEVEAQIQAWTQELEAGTCPQAIQSQLYKLLFKPDKNSPEYKAMAQAARALQLSPLALLQHAGALGDDAKAAYDFHWQRFIFSQFPQGLDRANPEVDVSAILDGLREAKTQYDRTPVQAFSIDDASTTEIDDALSVQGLGTGTITLGIHIAAPGLYVQPEDELDELARARYSTVYVPGSKITMLPSGLVEAFTLQEGDYRPALSLYVRFSEHSFELIDHETKVEKVFIANNLRLETMEPLVAQAMAGEDVEYPFQDEIRWLYSFAQVRKMEREEVRGKPETFNRPDYQFVLESADGERKQGTITGDERVSITPRRRGHPLDMVVSECMILANSTWGGWLAGFGVPAIYRNQAALAPGVKVRMSTKALKHAGIGVDYYAWSTSPLRRYVDLVNQWQIIAAAKHGATAALQAPFKPKDAGLFAIISGFESAYSAYAAFQRQMERFWTLRYIEQEGVKELDGVVIKPGVVRAATLPLVIDVVSPHAQQRGTPVHFGLQGVDLLSLEAFVQQTELSAGDMQDLADAFSDSEEDAEDEDGSDKLEIAFTPDDDGGDKAD